MPRRKSQKTRTARKLKRQRKMAALQLANQLASDPRAGQVLPVLQPGAQALGTERGGDTRASTPPLPEHSGRTEIEFVSRTVKEQLAEFWGCGAFEPDHIQSLMKRLLVKAGSKIKVEGTEKYVDPDPEDLRKAMETITKLSAAFHSARMKEIAVGLTAGTPADTLQGHVISTDDQRSSYRDPGDERAEIVHRALLEMSGLSY